MNSKPWMIAALLALATARSPAAADAPDPKLVRYGEHLSRECTSCHRRDGTDNGIPSLLGMKEEFFASTISFYRTGQRNNPAMVSVATSLEEDQIKALAAYFSTLAPPPKAAGGAAAATQRKK